MADASCFAVGQCCLRVLAGTRAMIATPATPTSVEKAAARTNRAQRRASRRGGHHQSG